MPTALKCPNPPCPFLFDPTQVPAGAVLTCPRCGMRFALGGTAAAQASAPPVGNAPPSRARDAGGSPWLVTLGVCAVIAAAVTAGFLLLGKSTAPQSSSNVTAFKDYNFSWEPPAGGWERDTDPPVGIRANLFSYRRTDAETRVAFFASDFKTRIPQGADLREPILDRLSALFEDLDPQEEKNATWLDHPAVKYVFRGKDRKTGEIYAGDAFGVTHAGIAYWTIAWAPEREISGQLDSLAELRQRLKLLDTRKDWKPTTTLAQTFSGESAEYKLIDSERWWAKPEGISPQDAAGDANADLLLRAVYRSKSKSDIKPRAELICFVLDSGGDPLDAARKLVAERYRKRDELFGKTTLSDIATEPEGDPPGTEEATATPLLRLHAANAKDPSTSKLHVLAAINAGGKVVVAEAVCAWSERSVWERRLMAVAGSLQLGR
jgi:hypothetical protein